MAAKQTTSCAEPDRLTPLRGLLPRYGLSSISDIRLLNVSENYTYLVSDCATPRRVILRVHRPGYHSREAIQSELAWIEQLRAEQIIVAPAVLKDRAGEQIQEIALDTAAPPRHVVLFEFLSGEEPRVSDASLPQWFTTLGELTARLHAHARRWVRPPWFTRHVWDTNAMHGERHLWGRWQDSIGLSTAGAQTLREAVDMIAVRLGEYGTSAARFGLIHADLRLANLLVEDQSLKVLDFDDMGFSWFLYDFASAISFFEDAPHIPELATAWLTGYVRLQTVHSEDLAVLPTLVMARRILLTAWVASHAEAPYPKQLGARFTDVTVELARRYLADRLLVVS